MPPNPEDEDDLVPDQHAAFGIAQAMAAGRDRHGAGGGVGAESGGAGGRGAPAWRDFEALDDLVRGTNLGGGGSGSGSFKADLGRGFGLGSGTLGAGAAIARRPRPG